MDNCLITNNIEVTNDTRILATAVDYYSENQNNFYFITNDLALKAIAGIFFNKDLIIIHLLHENVNFVHISYFLIFLL